MLVPMPMHATSIVVLMPLVMPTAATFFIHILFHLDFILILLEVKHLSY